MHAAVLASAISIFSIVAYQDLRTRRIPNALSLGIVALGLARIAFTAEVVDAGYTMAAAMIIFGVTFALFLCGAIGGGDAKIVPAAALLIGYRELLGFLFLMSLCGGGLALATLAAAKLDPTVRRFWRATRAASAVETDRGRVAPEERTVPYGVAVAAAGVITLLGGR